MRKLITVLMVVSALVACEDPSAARITLEKSGYSEIQTTGYVWMACGDDDGTHTGFRAKNPAGNVVEGVVCCGYGKGCTVRF